MPKTKTYSKPVFSGKDVPVIGLDQGKGKLYHGLGSWACYNFFYDVSMNSREGQRKTDSYIGHIQDAGKEDSLNYVQEDTNLWIEG